MNVEVPENKTIILGKNIRKNSEKNLVLNIHIARLAWMP